MSQNLSMLFSVPLWSFKAENPVDLNKHLFQAVKEEQKTDAGVSISNQGGWQSHGKLHFKDEFKDLVDLINKNLLQVGKDYGFGVMSSKLKVTSMWANVNDKACSNALHSHQSPVGMPNPW